MGASASPPCVWWVRLKVVESVPRNSVTVCTAGSNKHAAVALPVSATVLGLLEALLVMVSVPVSALPTTVGAKVTVTAQLAPAASDAGQVLVWVYGPLMEMLEIVSGAVPLLVSVTLRGVHVWFTCVSGSVSEVAERVSCAVDPPVPLNVTVCGLPGAPSVKVSVPVTAPVAVGVKITLTVHVPPGPSVAGQLLVWEKPAEVAMLVIAKLDPPVLLTVTGMGLDGWLTGVVGNVKLVVESAK